MSPINSYQTLIIAAAVLLGLFFGQFHFFANYAEYFVVPFLMVMLFGLFLNIPIKDLLKSFKNLKFLSANLLINFLWTPLLAYLLGYLFLQNEPGLWIGFVMLLVTPCTDWYLIFTGMAKGNVPLSASVLPLNLLLQIVLLPLYLLFFFEKSGTVYISAILESILLVLLVPFVLAQLVKYLACRRKSDLLSKRVMPFFDTGQVIFLALAIMAMFASQGEYLINNPTVITLLLLPLILFFILNFLLGRIVSNVMNLEYADSASLNLTTLARNSPISLAIAITAFPNEPLIALALVVGPLIELPVLFITSRVLLRLRKSGSGANRGS